MLRCGGKKANGSVLQTLIVSFQRIHSSLVGMYLSFFEPLLYIKHICFSSAEISPADFKVYIIVSWIETQGYASLKLMLRPHCLT